MKEDIQLLVSIYQNAQMGIIGIDNIIPDIENSKLKEIILEQRNDYQDILKKIEKNLHKLSHQPEEISSIAKIMTYIDAKINTMYDHSSTNIAKMMIKGNDKGITEISKKIKDYLGQDQEIISLAKELFRIEKKNLNTLKKFLSTK